MKTSIRRGRLMKILGLLALVLLLSAIAINKRVAAYSCALPGSCNDDASCTGDYYTRSGCSITCYRNVPNGGGQITVTSSATCSAVKGPGGIGE